MTEFVKSLKSTDVCLCCLIKQGVTVVWVAGDHGISHLNSYFMGEIPVEPTEFLEMVIAKPT